MLIQTLTDHILDILFPLGKKGMLAELDRVNEQTLDRLYSPQFITDDQVALFPYKRRAIRALIHSLKYYGRTDVADIVAPYFNDFLLEEVGDRYYIAQTPILIPIPLTNAKQRERGYNQSALLARALNHASDGVFEVYEDVLLRIGDRVDQVHTKSRRQRQENVAGVFEIQNKTPLAGASVVVIDDVITTGATTREAVRVLKAGGAAEVLALSVAH